MVRFLLFTGCWLASMCLAAQNKKIDSLKRVLSQLETHTGSFQKDTQTIHIKQQLSYHYYRLPDYSKAVTYATQSLELSNKIAWDKGQIMSYRALCLAKYKLGLIYECIQLMYKSLALAEKNKLVSEKLTCIRLIADYFSTLHQRDSAVYHYKRLIKLYEKADQPNELGTCYLNLATTLRDMPGQDPIAYYKKAEQVFIATQNHYWLGNVYHSFSDHLVNKKQLDSAYYYLQKGIFYLKKSNNEADLTGPYNELAYLFALKKEFKNAIFYGEKSLASAIKTNNFDDIQWAYEALYEAYKGLGNHERALAFHEKYLATKTGLLENKAKTQLELYRLQAKTEKEIQQKTIDNQNLTNQQQRSTLYFLIGLSVLFLALAGALFWNNRTLRKKNAEIREAHFKGQTSERKRVAAELHDNLGSQLSAMRWSMLAMNKDNLNPNEIEIYDNILTMMNNSYDQVRNMSHNLMPEELETKGLVKTLETLVRQLNRNKKLHFKLQANDFTQRLDKKIEFELYSVLLELINNILKHSEASDALIELTKSKENLQITVSDNGKGIVGADKHSGRGISGIQQRIKQLNGEFIIESNDPGSRFSIRI